MDAAGAHKLAILELAERHDRAVAERRVDDWLATWAPGGVLEGPFGVYRGDDLRRFAAAFLEASRGRRHWTAHHEIVVAGSIARMACDFLVIETAGAPKVVANGTYDDELRLGGDGWRFARRTLHVAPGWFLGQPAAPIA